MESTARLLGHPIQRALVAFPLGLLGTAGLFDILALVTDSPLLVDVAYALIAAGLVGAVVAAPFEFVDWMALPRQTAEERSGRLHGIGNTVVALLFAASWLLRRDHDHEPTALALTLSFGGALLLVLLTAWLGDERGVRPGASGVDEVLLDAPGGFDAASAGLR